MRKGRSIVIAAAAAMGLLAGCMGGSDGIENPKVELDFRGPDGSTATGAGEVRIYGRHLNPKEDSEPLLVEAFDGRAYVELDAAELEAALRARLGGSLPDTVVDFNVVAVADEREAFVPGFRYRRAAGKGSFAQGEWDAADLEYGAVRRRVELPAAVKDFKGALGANGMAFGIDYVYIPGSPYFADVEPSQDVPGRGEFRFARMSGGAYSLLGADKDSAALYLSRDTLRTSDSGFTAKTWDVFTIFD